MRDTNLIENSGVLSTENTFEELTSTFKIFFYQNNFGASMNENRFGQNLLLV
jgi:hypothetical protein